MSHHAMDGRILDARPDRIDFRDRPYQPPLVSLPDQFPTESQVERFLPLYHESGKILNQGTEGACTGFGLAAVINFILWERWMWVNDGRPAKDSPGPQHVSPWMLYEVARVYDEWEGEDYSGSSCRGAMKGWHKHGVCSEVSWSKRTSTKKGPDQEWNKDAAHRPLGAYYRVETRSISDMQAAIHEVRAVYCSARIHAGWRLDGNHKPARFGNLEVPIINMSPDVKVSGGHAFALVGYTKDGFIVQNSWGPKWGKLGFALLTYEDWALHGNDAWVAAMAAPMRISEQVAVPKSMTDSPLHVTAAPRHNLQARAGSLPVWTRDDAYEHAVVLGNDGKVLRRMIDMASAKDNLNKVMLELPSEALKDGRKHVMLFAHGGLNSEKVGIERAMRMGPWFEANGIYPIFLIWRTSLWETITNIGADFTRQFRVERDNLRSKGLGDLLQNAIDKLQDQFDKAFEAAAEKAVGKAVWLQMKQNAEAAANGNGGARQIVTLLKKLRAAHPQMQLHFVGHSAGSILLGHMLDDLDKANPVTTASLFAPACTMQFAERYYGKAIDKKIIPKGALHVDNLSDKNERSDKVGPYGKSLLYLVSRAFEDPRKMPLLGLRRAWRMETDLFKLKEALDRDFAGSEIKHVRDWAHRVRRSEVVQVVRSQREFPTKISEQGVVQIKASHGAFDNSLDVITDTVERILGPDAGVKTKITDLSGF